MKYKHEFAIKHLPMFVIGMLIIIIGGMCMVALVNHWITDTLSGLDLLWGMAAAAGYAVGGMVLSDGVEYTQTLAKEDAVAAHYESKRPQIDPWSLGAEIDRRREEVLGYDFNPSPAEIEAATKKKKQDLKTALKSQAFEDQS